MKRIIIVSRVFGSSILKCFSKMNGVVMRIRVNKHRKHIDNQLEIIRTTINIFLPLYNVLMLISNLFIIFRSKDYCKLIAMIEDIDMSSEEKEDLNE